MATIKLHELSTTQIIALKMVAARMGLINPQSYDMSGEFSVGFGHVFNQMQRRLGGEVTSTYTDEFDANLQAFWQYVTGGEATWDLDAGGVVNTSDGSLWEEWANIPTQEAGLPETPDDPEPPEPDITEEATEPVAPPRELDYRQQAINYLDQYGLATPELINIVDEALQNGFTDAIIEAQIMASDDFQLRFPYYQTLVDRGVSMSIGQLVDYERGVVEMLHRFGLSDIYQIPDNAFNVGGGTGGGGGGGSTPPSGSNQNTGDAPTGNRAGTGGSTGTSRGGGTYDPSPNGNNVTGNPPTSEPVDGVDNQGNPVTSGGGSSGGSSNNRGRGSGSGGGGGSNNNSGGRGGGSDQGGDDYGGLPGIVGSEVQDLIQDLIENDVSLAELGDRLMEGYAQVFYAAPEVQQFFASAYGPAGEAALAAYFLDPDIDVEVLIDRAEVATLGGMSTLVFQDETVNLMRAERMQQVGITQARAVQAFAQLNELGALFEETIGEQSDFVKSQLGVDALLGLSPDAMRTLEQRRRSRIAAFSGGGDYFANQSGITGFGTSAT